LSGFLKYLHVSSQHRKGPFVLYLSPSSFTDCASAQPNGTGRQEHRGRVTVGHG
jgi:hypothetical protein